MRIYTVQFNNVLVTALQDMISLTTGATMACELHELVLAQANGVVSSNLLVSIKRLSGALTAGSGGTLATPSKLLLGDPAATIVGRTNDTTQALGTSTIIRSDVFNTAIGYLYQPMRDDRPVFGLTNIMAFSLDLAPAAGMRMSGTATFAETL